MLEFFELMDGWFGLKLSLHQLVTDSHPGWVFRYAGDLQDAALERHRTGRRQVGIGRDRKFRTAARQQRGRTAKNPIDAVEGEAQP